MGVEYWSAHFVAERWNADELHLAPLTFCLGVAYALHKGASVTPICRSPFSKRIFSTICQSHKTRFFKTQMVSQTVRILLANLEISLYCPIKRFLVDQNKTNNKTCMAGVYGQSDVCLETCFLQIYYKNILCSIKTCKSDTL